MNMIDIKEFIDQKKGERESIEKLLAEKKKEKISLEKRLINIELAQVFLQNVAKETQEKICYHIEDIVQLAIDTCFPGEYEFSLGFEIKRGSTEAKIKFLKNGNEIDPMKSAGGGVVDMAAFGLRIAVWSLSTTDNVIILDEPFRFLSKDLQPKAGQILKRLSEKLGLQFIMVTHNEDIVDSADKIFTVKKESDKSRIIVR